MEPWKTRGHVANLTAWKAEKGNEDDKEEKDFISRQRQSKQGKGLGKKKEKRKKDKQRQPRREEVEYREGKVGKQIQMPSTCGMDDGRKETSSSLVST
ncbi:uncharacterized protein ARB_00243 [Trichophyton benhamiae CBS 112371]|uniref:Uncharacterized protein n=1 Tax=Arthroderma benhamiae (strain ATCC MYA-4681 / CBS 112371) TaxID=663331 RepID=D4AVM9_ARTBC|nr:uncharacterized protein ARB_00243 [Trichophyton benhamiae CBS 112371]EFE32785.1 hypothetical protein ARB_00243 [Trichophyton benhamiae CBS 112371]